MPYPSVAVGICPNVQVFTKFSYHRYKNFSIESHAERTQAFVVKLYQYFFLNIVGLKIIIRLINNLLRDQYLHKLTITFSVIMLESLFIDVLLILSKSFTALSVRK